MENEKNQKNIDIETQKSESIIAAATDWQIEAQKSALIAAAAASWQMETQIALESAKHAEARATALAEATREKAMEDARIAASYLADVAEFIKIKRKDEKKV